MSDYNQCTQCGCEIEEAGIQFRGKFFCSDECCEKYEQNLLDKDEPVLDELADDEDADLLNLDEDLDYNEDEDDEDLLDDDFDIKPEDF